MSVFLLILAGWCIASAIAALIIGPWLKSVTAEYEEASIPVNPDPAVARIQGICRHMSYTPGCTDCKVRAIAAADHMNGAGR